MKKIRSTLFLFFILAVPGLSSAADRTITVEWTVPTASVADVQSYTLYYSEDSTMSGAVALSCAPWQQTGVEGEQTRFSMTCDGIPDVPGQYAYFMMETEATGGTKYESTVYSRIFGLAPVRDFKLEVTAVGGDIISPTATIITTPTGTEPNYAINFQPSGAPIPAGYQMDSGGAFDTERGYGWTSDPASMGARDRDNAASPDQSYDTMIHVAPTGTWEIELPNGNYSVTICVGDASYPDGTNNVQVEGSTVVDNVTLSSAVPWTEKTGTVTVADGRLTVTFIGSDPLARLCWLTITAL